jgi:hypothetical protein
VIDSILRGFKRIGSDLLKGRNIEAYAVTFIGVVLVIMDVIGEVDDSLKLTVIIAALVVLVFRLTKPEVVNVDLDKVLLDRQSYGPFREFIAGAKELWVYGPSNANVLREAPFIEKEILDKGGGVKILIQNPKEAAAMNILKQILDRNHDLSHDIQGSLYTLHAMAKYPKMEYRLLAYNPGFSLTVVDPDGKNGRLIVEFFGFRNDRISDRMHILITRHQSQYWFEFWESQFRVMWEEGLTEAAALGDGAPQSDAAQS